MYVCWAKRWEWRPEQMQEVWSPEPHKSTCWNHAVFSASPQCWSQAKLIQRKCAGPAAAPQSSWDPLQPAGADKSGSHSWAQIKAVKLTGENAAQPGVGRLLLWGEALRHSLQTHSLTHTHTYDPKDASTLFSPPSHVHVQIFIFSWFPPPISFNWKVQKKSHLSLLPISCQNNQWLPERPGGADEQVRIQTWLQGTATDNKWGTVLGYVLQLSSLIIFDMYCGVYRVPVKPPAIHLTGWGEVLKMFCKRKSNHALMRVPFLIHGTILSVNTCQLTDFLFPVAYEKIMAMWFRVNTPISINSPWSSWNIRWISVFATKSCASTTDTHCKKREGVKKNTKIVALKIFFTYVHNTAVNRPWNIYFRA